VIVECDVKHGSRKELTNTWSRAHLDRTRVYQGLSTNTTQHDKHQWWASGTVGLLFRSS